MEWDVFWLEITYHPKYIKSFDYTGQIPFSYTIRTRLLPAILDFSKQDRKTSIFV